MTSQSVVEARYQAVGNAQWITAGRGQRFRSLLVVRDLWLRRGLILLLTKREIRSRFKDSNLGMVWSFARPLAQFAVYYFVLGELLSLSRQIDDFAVFVFVGLTGWLFFSESVVKATSSIVTNASLVKKVQLPREVFPLSAVGSVAFMSLVQVLVLVAALAALRKPPRLDALPYAAAGLGVIVTFTVAIGVLLSALNVTFRDIEHLAEVSMVVLFWASPVVYSFGFVHDYLGGNWIEQLYLSNPVTVGILGLQRGLWSSGADAVWPPMLWLRLLVMLVVALGTLAVAHLVFIRREGDFAQEI